MHFGPLFLYKHRATGGRGRQKRWKIQLLPRLVVQRVGRVNVRGVMSR